MRTKQVRLSPKEFEYELLISKEHDSILNKDYILFDFKTAQEFESFIYNINISETIDLESKELIFLIEGLSAPQLSLAKTGQAGYQYRFFDFKNTEYTLKIIKHDKEKNLFKFKILHHKNNKLGQENIILTRQPSKKFIKIITQ